MKKQPEITEATRKRLVTVFCELYQTQPIEKITVKEVASMAGYNRTTFYQYFQDVYDIRDYLEQDFVGYVASIMVSKIEKGLVMEDITATFARILEEREFQARALMNDPSRGHLMQLLRAELMPALLRAFHIADDNVRARYTLEFYLPGVVSVFGRWFQNGQDLPATALGELIGSILSDGVLAQLAPRG